MRNPKKLLRISNLLTTFVPILVCETFINQLDEENRRRLS